MTRNELLLFGERIRDQRNAIRMTQEQVAEESDISLRFYQMIERGEKSVSLDTLIRLSKTLNSSVDYLLFGKAADSLNDPITDMFEEMTLQQRKDATMILQL